MRDSKGNEFSINSPELACVPLKHINGVISVIRDAVAAEREACAKVAETAYEGYESVDFLGGTGKEIAAAIRARGQ